MTIDAIDKMWRIEEGARAIDWAILVVDFLVLLVIVVLDTPERFHKFKVRRRLRTVYIVLAEGQRLHESAPPAGTTDASIADAWIVAVQQWIQQTHQALAKFSVAAGMSFNSRKVAPDINYGGITMTSNARGWYGELLHRLANLQNIMEKADVYF